MKSDKWHDVLRCPFCDQEIINIIIKMSFENEWDFDLATRKWMPYAFMPDQGDAFFKCEYCKKKVTVSDGDPSGLTQEELNDMNGRSNKNGRKRSNLKNR